MIKLFYSALLNCFFFYFIIIIFIIYNYKSSLLTVKLKTILGQNDQCAFVVDKLINLK